jgi:hypothetical protein
MATYLFIPTDEPEAAVRAVRTVATPPDLCVTSPSPAARETAARAMRGRWIFTVEEPLLAARAPGEGSDDVVARYAQALRGLRAYETRSALVVCDDLRPLGGEMLVLTDEALARVADELEHELPPVGPYT